MSPQDLADLVAENEDLFDAKWRGIEFGPGWGELFTEMLDRCRREGAPPIRITKEKLGTLRISFSDQSNPNARRIREEAIHRSSAICEVCGSPGLHSHPHPGFLATRCRSHIDQ